MPVEKPKKSREQRNNIETNNNQNIEATEKSLASLKTDFELWELKNEILNVEKVDDAPEKSEQEMMLEIVRDLLNKYKALKKWIRSTEWNFQAKMKLITWLNENIENLENIRKDLWWDNKSLKDMNMPVTMKENAYKYSDLTVYKARIWELIYYYELYEQNREEITLWKIPPYIHTIIDSKQDEKKARH